jgi:dienelactone hydrolase
MRSRCLCWSVFGLLLPMLFNSCSSPDSGQKKIPENISPAEPPSPRTDFSSLAGKITDNVVCDAQPQLSYCLYLPSAYSATKTFQVIFIFDAHGDGKLPVEKYHNLAEESGFILIASNNSRNGIQYDSLMEIARAMMSDASGKIAIDSKRKYVMGFSGGARVAGAVAATEQNIAGVIGCGAAYLDENAKAHTGQFFFGFAGKDDFNLLEMFRMHEYFANAGVKNYFEVFEGKHEWPDSATMRNAFSMLTVTDSKEKQNLEKKISKNTVTPAMAKTFEAESELQNKYIGAFSKENILWWNSEIVNLQKCAASGTDKEKVHQCRRLLAYIGVAIYSYSNNAIKNHSDADAEKLLQIYKMVDSQNNEQRYLEAILRARQGDKLRALALLNEAVGLGFNDVSRMQNEADFQSLKGMTDYSTLLGKINSQHP